ncbi:MAG: glycosyltransferase family 4 protein [Cryobacterium sp.]|nr:glycosyltransferase family 4 protein [Cryobacterium sp.]
MTRVLIITGDPIGIRMAGPAIRAWNIAAILAKENEVVLMTTTSLEQIAAPFRLARVRPGEDTAFRELEAWAEVVVFQGHAMTQFRALHNTKTIVVADIYDPMHLEMLEQGRELARATWELQVRTATDVLNDQLSRADFFLCASERQRMFYLGQLATLGRVNPATYEHDPHLSRLIAVAPFGLSATPPLHETQVVKGVRPGISPSDKLLLWGGGIYNWFDPLTLIAAVAQVSERRPDLRLLFLGTRHPGVDEMGMVRKAVDLARELGVLDSSVYFNESWVEYAQRQNWLLEADAGVSTHMAHIETTFAFRTRILDYLWAGLPMVVTEGDSFAELVATEELGVVVPPQDVAALAAAIERVLYDDEFAAAVRINVQRVREEFVWERVLAPLTEFVRSPRRAADRVDGRVDRSYTGKRPKQHGLRRDALMFWHYLRAEGLARTLKRMTSRTNRSR